MAVPTLFSRTPCVCFQQNFPVRWNLLSFSVFVMLVLLLVWVGIFLLDLSIFYSSMLNPTKCLILLTIGISKPAPYSIASHPTEKCFPTLVTSFVGRNHHILAPCHLYPWISKVIRWTLVILQLYHEGKFYTQVCKTSNLNKVLVYTLPESSGRYNNTQEMKTRILAYPQNFLLMVVATKISSSQPLLASPNLGDEIPFKGGSL